MPHDLLPGGESEAAEGLHDDVEVLGRRGSGCRGPEHFSFVVDDEVEAPEADHRLGPQSVSWLAIQNLVRKMLKTRKAPYLAR